MKDAHDLELVDRFQFAPYQKCLHRDASDQHEVVAGES
jgi:hypothetical protein